MVKIRKLASIEKGLEEITKVLSEEDIKKAINEFEVIAVLVKHKEFTYADSKKIIQESNVLDFCGLFKG